MCAGLAFLLADRIFDQRNRKKLKQRQKIPISHKLSYNTVSSKLRWSTAHLSGLKMKIAPLFCTVCHILITHFKSFSNAKLSWCYVMLFIVSRFICLCSRFINHQSRPHTVNAKIQQRPLRDNPFKLKKEKKKKIRYTSIKRQKKIIH